MAEAAEWRTPSERGGEVIGCARSWEIGVGSVVGFLVLVLGNEGEGEEREDLRWNARRIS